MWEGEKLIVSRSWRKSYLHNWGQYNRSCSKPLPPPLSRSREAGSQKLNRGLGRSPFYCKWLPRKHKELSSTPRSHTKIPRRWHIFMISAPGRQKQTGGILGAGWTDSLAKLSKSQARNSVSKQTNKSLPLPHTHTCAHTWTRVCAWWDKGRRGGGWECASRLSCLHSRAMHPLIDLPFSLRLCLDILIPVTASIHFIVLSIFTVINPQILLRIPQTFCCLRPWLGPLVPFNSDDEQKHLLLSLLICPGCGPNSPPSHWAVPTTGTGSEYLQHRMKDSHYALQTA